MLQQTNDNEIALVTNHHNITFVYFCERLVVKWRLQTKKVLLPQATAMSHCLFEEVILQGKFQEMVNMLASNWGSVELINGKGKFI